MKKHFLIFLMGFSLAGTSYFLFSMEEGELDPIAEAAQIRMAKWEREKGPEWRKEEGERIEEERIDKIAPLLGQLDEVQKELKLGNYQRMQDVLSLLTGLKSILDEMTFENWETFASTTYDERVESEKDYWNALVSENLKQLKKVNKLQKQENEFIQQLKELDYKSFPVEKRVWQLSRELGSLKEKLGKPSPTSFVQPTPSAPPAALMKETPPTGLPREGDDDPE